MKKEALINKIKILIEKHEKRVLAVKKELKENDAREITTLNTMYAAGFRCTLAFLEKTIKELKQLIK